MNFKKNFQSLQIKSFLLGIITVVGGFWYFGQSDETATPAESISTQTIERGNISSTIKVLGTAEIVDEQKLRFNQLGKITAVYFQDGEKVEEGNLIAEMDKSDAYSDIEQAEISLQNSRLSLQEVLDGDTEIQVAKAKNTISETIKKIETATKNFELAIDEEKNTIQSLENSINQAKKDTEDKTLSLETAEKDLENTKIFEADSLENTKISYESSLEKYVLQVKNDLVVIDTIMKKIDAILGVEPATKDDNNEYETYLGFGVIGSKQIAKDAYFAAKQQTSVLQSQYDALSSKGDWTEEEIIDLLQTEKETFSVLSTATDKMFVVVDSSVTNTVLTISKLDGFISSISGSQTTTQNKITSIQSDITTIKNIEETSLTELKSSDTIRKKEELVRNAQISLQKSQDALEVLENEVEIKKENARLSVIAKENELDNLQNSLDISRLDLADIQSGATAERIAMAQNDVKQKQLSLAKVQQNLEKYEITAPFDGMLRKIDFQVGDNLLADDDKYVYIENPDLLNITVLLDQIDIVKIKQGFDTRITFDSYPDKVFEGTIEEIDQSPVVQSGVVSYQASIILEKGDNMLFSGMTSSIEIILLEKNDVLLIPNLSIQSRRGKSTVQKMVNGKAQTVEIETGVTDGKNTEVISGLSENDEIVKVSFASSAAGGGSSDDSVRQLMRASGGGGGTRTR